MIDRVFLLILGLMATTLTPEFPSWWALFFLYAFISLQALWLSRYPWISLLVQLELIVYLAFFHGSPISGVFEYLGGIALLHGIGHNGREAIRQLRFIAPFTFPFILLYLAGMVHVNEWVSLALNLGILAVIVVFMAPILVYFWGCPPMPESPLRERLDAFCQRNAFKHGGFRIWNVLPNALTAAILGVIAPFRYILFTPRVLNRLSPNALEAILAHEIGHHARKHLLIYPFIMLGAMVLGIALFFPYLTTEEIFPIWAAIVYLLLTGLYFRFVFGYFSRLFERQADLHVFETKVPAEYLIEALDQVANASGGTHKDPSWHHFSIQERIDFLKKADISRDIIAKHHRTTYISLYIYVALLVAISLYFVLLN